MGEGLWVVRRRGRQKFRRSSEAPRHSSSVRRSPPRLRFGEEAQGATLVAASEGSPVLREPAATVSAARRAKRKRRGESRSHGWLRRTSGDGARATPKPRLSQGLEKPREPRTCGQHVGGAGKSFVVSRRTSSLLKRSPIPASPSRWQGSPRRNTWRRQREVARARRASLAKEPHFYSTRPSSVISRAW